jgi:hypothetical protein
MTLPLTPDATRDARQDAIWQRLRLRFFTSAGNVVEAVVPALASSLTVTFPREEPDARYGVSVTPSWDTTVWVGTKTTTGCTINFGTAPVADATLDLLTFRSE